MYDVSMDRKQSYLVFWPVIASVVQIWSSLPSTLHHSLFLPSKLVFNSNTYLSQPLQPPFYVLLGCMCVIVCSLWVLCMSAYVCVCTRAHDPMSVCVFHYCLYEQICNNVFLCHWFLYEYFNHCIFFFSLKGFESLKFYIIILFCVWTVLWYFDDVEGPELAICVQHVVANREHAFLSQWDGARHLLQSSWVSFQNDHRWATCLPLVSACAMVVFACVVMESLMITYIALFSAVLSRLTALACGFYMSDTLFFLERIFLISTEVVYLSAGMAGATWNCSRLGASYVYTIQPCIMSLHAKPHT